MADEHAVGAEATFGKERVRAREWRGRVLVPRQPQPPRCSQRCRAGFAGGGQVGGVAAFCTLGRDPFTLRCLLGSAGVGLDLRSGVLPRFPLSAAFPGRFDQRRSMELLGLAHSARPRDTDDDCDCDGANQSSSSSTRGAGRRARDCAGARLGVGASAVGS